ncbi:SGNH/GDSL hydrolase family protein [Rossellomorea sp. FM04394]|uniref:SGNH/GDSL hydrolase family protein n=1 Tax=Rossellomorea sp. FM04394 TaxID=3243076 RepID=UPI0035A630E6
MKNRKKLIFAFFLCVAIGMMIGCSSKQEITAQSSSDHPTHKPVYEKLEHGEPIQYLVVGDSIGEGVGASTEAAKWTSIFNEKITERYTSEVKSIRLTKGGSDSFDGLVEFNNYKTSKDYDLVFVSFGQNDQNYLSEKEFNESYSSLVENIMLRFPKAEVFTFIEHGLEKKEYRETIEDVSNQYDLNIIDAQQAFNESGKDVAQLSDDRIHPNDEGYQLYADEILNKIGKKVEDKDKPEILAKVMADLKRHTTDFHGTPNAKNGFKAKETYFVSDTNGAFIEFKVDSKDRDFLGVSLITNKDGGFIEVYIDNEMKEKISTYSPYPKKRHFLIDKDISKGKHTVKLVVTGEKSKNSSGNIARVIGVQTR